MSVTPARRAALKAIARVRRSEGFSGAVLSAELASASLSASDAARATQLTYGVLAAEGVLDEAIDRHARAGLEPTVRDALRMAGYELFFGSEPAYAVVNQCVDAVRHHRPQAAGLANAVARRLADSASTFPWGDPERDRDALGRATGHPRWIVDVALDDLGERAGRQMLACGMEPAPTYVRLDPFAASREEVLARLVDAAPHVSQPDEDCFRLDAPAAAFRGAQDAWFPMDAAAQMAPRACAPEPNEAVLDVGAGRGNKTMCLQALACRQGGPAQILAIDLHEGKVAALRRRLDSSGVPGVEVRAVDALDLEAQLEGEAFDVVLLDAPCTGLGTLRRYPEKRWRLSASDVSRMAGVQVGLLESCSAAVRIGGRMVYSTCSISRQENDGAIDAFLASERGRSFDLKPAQGFVPGEWAEFVSARGCFQSWPTSGGPDGHFAAVVRRRNG